MSTPTDSNQPDSQSAGGSNRAAGEPAPASPELTGGAGFSFEDGAVAIYAAALLSQTTAPGMSERVVIRFAVQQGSFGEPLDDLIVDGVSPDGVTARVSLQIKRSLTISDAATNKDFRETILRAHTTVAAEGFNRDRDRVGVITGEIAEGARRSFEALCEWARSSSDELSFSIKVATEGVASNTHRAQLDAVRSILGEKVPANELPEAAYRLLSCFVLVRFDLLHEGSPTAAATIVALAQCLQPSERGCAGDLYHRVLSLVRVSEGRAADFDRKTFVARLNGAFRLQGAPSLQATLRRLTEEARFAVAEIQNEIGGAHIARPLRTKSAKDALDSHRVVLLSGLPGTGKSAVLRSLIDEALGSGAVLFLKADRLAGASWSQYATAVGTEATALEELLVELRAVGTSTVFIDGLDRVEVRCRGVVLDLMQTIFSSELLSDWKVVATVRDNGLEPVRTWLSLLRTGSGIAIVDVGVLGDSESKALAEKHPALQPLLFGPHQVREIVRRPFFASVLVRNQNGAESVPKSEVELATAWWNGGGYSAIAGRAGHRRKALLQLALDGAMTLGRRIPGLEIDPDALAELQEDGIVIPVRQGHTYRFAHDIYFEWSFLQALVSKREKWLDVIQQVGEPPVLGRAVELLSQSELVHGEDWAVRLEELEAAKDIRSQWLRAWLTGVFAAPDFLTRSAEFDKAMLAQAGTRVSKLALWFQAEKTKPNPSAFDVVLLPNLSALERIRLADAGAWPSDLLTWTRLCSWLVRHEQVLPVACRPDVLTVFEVWQNGFRDLPGPLSNSMLLISARWLDSLQTTQSSEAERTVWADIDYSQLRELEQRLRILVLRAARAYPTQVGAYLDALGVLESLPQHAFDHVVACSRILAVAVPSSLVDFVLGQLPDDDPVSLLRNGHDGRYRSSFHDHDWQRLAIHEEHNFAPAAPTREPFASLFAVAPDEARRLVRDLANHAVKAWRQLHRVVPRSRRRGTPIPVVLYFPWGKQVFWGDSRVYVWSRGREGPAVVESGLMALEVWASEQISAGRPADEVVKLVLEGHDSVAALGVVAAIMLEAQQYSPMTLAILCSQRLWAWDIARCLADRGMQTNLMGFMRKSDVPHRDAVVAGNQKPSRRGNLRDLASICILRGGGLSEAASAAIRRFAAELPFDFHEERSDALHVAELQRIAEIWAEVGNRSNYTATPTDDGSATLIELKNPKAVGPDIDAINRRQEQMAEHFRLLNWIKESFDLHQIGNDLSIEQAILRARALDDKRLFDIPHDLIEPDGERQSAVAGTAAVALRFGAGVSGEDIAWANDVCMRACRTAGNGGGIYMRESVLPHHPVLFAAYGFGGALRIRPNSLEVLKELMRLAGHPYAQISLAAIESFMLQWGTQSHLAWLGLSLGVGLSLVPRTDGKENFQNFEHQQARHIEQLVASTLSATPSAGDEPEPLPSLPVAWIRSEKGEWGYSNVIVDWRFLKGILSLVPLADVLASHPHRQMFLTWCDSAVAWTVDRLDPLWLRDEPSEEALFKRKKTDMYEWRRHLYRFLAQVAIYLDPTEAVSRFITPIVRADDEVFESLAEPFLDALAARLLDQEVFPESVYTIVEATLPRLLEHDDWDRASWDDGVVHNTALHQIVQSLFFVAIEHAGGAARFANGNWSEIERVLPLIDRFLQKAGGTTTVINAFLTLCERSVDAYPARQFLAQLSSVLYRQVGMLPGWRGSMIPSRISGLIQRFSERTQPMPAEMAKGMLRALDTLVDMGDRRAAAIQTSEIFKDVRTV